MEPFVKYPGGKSKEAPLVEKYLPKNIKRYFEPFVGGGAVFFKLNFKSSYINDFSKDLINLYKMIKYKNKLFFSYIDELNKLWKEIEVSNEFTSNNFDYKKYEKYYVQSKKRKNNTIQKFEKDGMKIDEATILKFDVTAKKTALYMLVRDIYNTNYENNELRSAAYYFIREYCYSSMFRFSKNGIFNVPYGGMSYNDKYLDKKISYIGSDIMKEKLSSVEIYNEDFEKFLNMFKMETSDFIFLDPPYDTNFSKYDNNVFDKNEQIRLKEYLSKTNAKWLLIIKKTDFIYELYKDFHIYQYEKNYMVSFKNRNEKNVQHILITNYEME